MHENRNERSDILATILAATAWSLGALPLLDPRPGHMLFRVAGTTVGAVTVFPALLLMYLEPVRRRAVSRFLFGLGAALFGSLGLSYAASAEPWQVAFGYLLPCTGLLAILVVQGAPSLDSGPNALQRTGQQALE